MNVMLAVPWDQRFGGVASVVGHLATHLKRNGHRVVFLFPGDGNVATPRVTAWGFAGYDMYLRPPFRKGRPLKSVVAFLVYLPVTLFRLRRLISSERIQIVNVHYPTESSWYFAALRWLLPVRLVVSVHGADVFPDGLRKGRYPWSVRCLMWAADAIVAPSAAFLRDCEAVFKQIAGRSVWIHNGVDLKELDPVERVSDAAENGPYVLTIAACYAKKGLDVLLVAFLEVSRRHPEVKLVIVGEGPLRKEHEALARSLGLEHRVTFAGARGRLEIGQLLRGCEVFVLPSRAEPFGIVVAEAMACRKAVVASAVGGIPEIVEDGTSGILIEPDDPAALARALLTVLEDSGLRESLGESGYRRVRERFGCGMTGARYEALYASLGGRGGSEHIAHSLEEGVRG